MGGRVAEEIIFGVDKVSTGIVITVLYIYIYDLKWYIHSMSPLQI